MKNRSLPAKEYKGYSIKPVINGIHVVYRNNQIIAVEPSLQIAMQAIDNRTYSNPDFNRSGYHQYDNIKKFKIKKDKKDKKVNAPRQQFTGIYKSVDMGGEKIKVEVVRGKDKEKSK